MKHFVLFILLFLLVGCTTDNGNDPDETLEALLEEIDIPTTVTSDLELPLTYPLGDNFATAEWISSNESIITKGGKVTFSLDDQNVTLTLFLSYDGKIIDKTFDLIVSGLNTKEFIKSAINSIEFITETKVNLTLPNRTTYMTKRVNLTYKTSNDDAFTNDGKVGLIAQDTEVILTVTGEVGGTTESVDITIKVIALSEDEQLNYIFNSINFGSTINQSLDLKTDFPFGINGEWKSDKINILDNSGKLYPVLSRDTVNLVLTLKKNNIVIGTRSFEMDVINNNHMIIDRDFNGEKLNLELNAANKLVLTEGSLEGVYTSLIYETLSATQIVASWAAISSEVATTELELRAKVDGVWSEYLTYHKWGLGLKNASPNASNTLLSRVDDEVNIRNNKTSEALQFRITLRRNTATDETPIVSLIAATLNVTNYKYNIDMTNLRRDVDYNVPMLQQNIVPTIGGSICSPTSSTMLLKYAGVDFSKLTNDEFEHRYFANLVNDYDPNNPIFGNWVYNTVGIGAFGFDSYVKRMYSIEELQQHLDTVGPVAASVKGTMIGESGTIWSTNGHLIVIRGYYYNDMNQLIIRANDPNLSFVREDYTVENFLRVWRNIVYVVE